MGDIGRMEYTYKTAYIILDCKMATVSSALMTCENDTMTVTWLTDVTYNATVSQIPADVSHRITERLVAAGRNPLLSLVITNRQPP